MTVNNELHKIILYHRKQAKLSRNELAELADVGKTVIYDLEKGKITVRWSTILAILDTLNIHLTFQSPLMEEYEKSTDYIHNLLAGVLTETKSNRYIFQYDMDYRGEPISLTMPVEKTPYEFKSFPPFFDGLLPEGGQLEGLLKIYKIDKSDYFTQLLVIGQDLVGAVTVEEITRTDE